MRELTKQGQPYYDEEVCSYPKADNFDPIRIAVASMFGEPVMPKKIVLGYNKVRLNWLPTPKNG